LICVFQAILNLALPSYWGNDIIYEKIKQQQEFNDDVNTLFIGTSRIYYHIDPLLFDKVTLCNSISYNIGSQGIAGLESYRIVDEIIHNAENSDIKTIFIEVPGFNLPSSKNSKSVRATYFINAIQSYRALRFKIDTKASWLSLMSTSIKACKTTLSNALGLQTFRTKCSILKEVLTKKSRLVRDSKRGFYGQERTVKKNSVVKSRSRIANKFYNSLSKSAPEEIEFLTKMINDQVRRAKENGINIVYVLMPKMSLKQYQDVYQSFSQLDIQNKINLSNPKEYPQYYNRKLSSDKVHLNTKGAKSMTKEFALHYNQFCS